MNELNNRFDSHKHTHTTPTKITILTGNNMSNWILCQLSDFTLILSTFKDNQRMDGVIPISKLKMSLDCLCQKMCGLQVEVITRLQYNNIHFHFE